MLQRIVGFSVLHRAVVIVVACLIIGYGIYSAAHAKYDVYPEFAPPEVVVQTEAPGLSPEEVENLVTRPVESVLNGAPDLQSIRSESIQGLSAITLVFREDADVHRARQTVSERLMEAAAQLPQGVKPPGMAPLTGATSMVLIVGLTSRTRSLMDLRTFADWTLRPRLLGVPGVARISIFGGEVRELEIQVIPERLAAFGLSLNSVVEAARKSTGVRGAGFIENASQRIILQTRGQSITPEELKETVLGYQGGVPVRLGDAAKVVEAAEPKAGDASIGGTNGVLVEVSSQYGANTLDVTAAVEKAIEEMKPAIAARDITLHPALFRPADFIETAVRNVNRSLLIGGLLVAAVLFLFLFNLRTAVISITAIPLSLLIAVIILYRMGISLNTLTLGGLAIAIGEVVDDAIIDVENIFRRLRQNALLGSPRPAFQVVLGASLEVRGAVVYATFVVALVFLPVLTMSGIQGRLFAPLAWAYILAILASLAVALTVTPALSFALLANRAAAAHGETRFVTGLKSGYAALLRGLTAHRGVLFAIALTLCGGAAAALPFFGASFLPDLREGHFIVHMAAVPGTSIPESLRLGSLVTRDLLKSRYVATVAQQVGRAEMADDIWGPHYSEIHVKLKPLSGEDAEAAEAEIRGVLGRFPGVYFAIRPFLAERIEEVISGVTAQVVIKVFGDNLDVLDGTAHQVAQVVSRVRGAVDVQVESPPGAPQVRVELRPERLKQFGFRPVDVLEAVQTAYEGTVVAQTYDENRVFDVVVKLDPSLRERPDHVGSLLLANADGLRVPLGELAAVFQTTGRYSILHDGTRRYQAVTCNVRGRDAATFVAEAERRVRSEVAFPAGVYSVLSGSEQTRSEAQRELLMYSIAAVAGILILLSFVFRNSRNLLLVLANIPFALVGGVLAVMLTGGYLTIGSLVGFVTLFGITTRNSIMMVSHFEHLVAVEGALWGFETAIRGALERLVPVLMTAIVTGLGLLPLALGSGQPGREIEGPMAIVILGGLATSTALNLLLLPALALRFGRFNPMPAESQA